MRIPTVTFQRNTIAASALYQFAGVIAFAAIVPWFIRFALEAGSPQISNLRNSLLGTIAAVALGQISFRQSIQYPGVRSTYGIAPSLVFAYGAVLVAFLLLRLDYSRLQFLLSFMLAVAWYFHIHRGLRNRPPRYAMIPFGATHELQNIRSARWIMLNTAMQATVEYDAIVADLHADIPDVWERFLADRALAGTPVFHYKHVRQSLTGRVEIEHLSENEFGSLIPGAAFVQLKRVIDAGVALLALVPIGLLLIPIAVAIKVDSAGPIFFKQRRVGYRGAIFTVYKLRTMRQRLSGEEGDRRSEAITRDDDTRITRLGAFLRRYRIDELPQILNILRGEMSWIGPRPEAVPLSMWYEEELPFYRYRHIVRPGLTGWAQVNQGHVADVSDVLWKLHYDFYYIRNFSIWLDLLIVGRTARTVLSGFGSK